MIAPHGPVLHFIDTTGPGGAETVFLNVADGLRRRGWAPRAALVGPGWVHDNVRRLQIAVDVIPTSGRLDLGYLRAIHSIVRTHGVRLIHAHLFSPAVYASLVAAAAGVPVLATFHGASDTDHVGLTGRLRYKLIQRYATIACVSEPLKDALVTRGLVEDDRVRVIHNGVDTAAYEGARRREIRREHGIPDEAILVGALGNLRPAKDFGTLIRAAAALGEDRRFRFAIVGDPAEPLLAELEGLRDSLGLRDRLSFWGFRSDVPDVMAAFDVLTISSATEGFSLAAIQAMAAGTPVVATRSGGPEQILTDGMDGLLVPVRAPRPLADAILRIADDPELRHRIAANAKETVNARFSLAAMLDAYEALYLKKTTSVQRERS